MKNQPYRLLNWIALWLSLCLVLGIAPSQALAEANQPAFVLQDLQGKSHRLQDYRGKWVIVNYWAPWCPPCLEEMPELVTFYDAHQAQVMVLGVAVQYESVKSVTDFSNDMLISYPVILGDAQKTQLPRIPVLPTTYFYRPDGSLYQIKHGALTKQALEKWLNLSSH